jgi:hypothetical protein
VEIIHRSSLHPSITLRQHPPFTLAQQQHLNTTPICIFLLLVKQSSFIVTQVIFIHFDISILQNITAHPKIVTCCAFIFFNLPAVDVFFISTQSSSNCEAVKNICFHLYCPFD